MARRVLMLLGFLGAAGVCLGVVFYAAARLASDRWALTQPLTWAPSWALLAAPTLAAAVSLLCFLGRPRASSRRPRLARRAVLGALLALGACGMHALVVDAGAARWVFPAAAAPPGRGLGIFHWNLTMPDGEFWAGDLTTLLPAGAAPDVVLLSSPQRRRRLEATIATLGPGYDIRRFGVQVVAARVPIRRVTQFALTTPATGPRPASLRRLEDLYNAWAPRLGVAARTFGNGEGAQAIFVELATADVLGRDTTVCFIDLPSDPFAGRMAQAALVRGALDRLCAEPAAPGGPPLAPEPDVIVGDFNTPRGAASLRRLAPGHRHAYAEAGRGDSATWPRAFPILHIDHVLLAPWLRAATYEVRPTPVADHWAQWCVVTPRRAP